jgi:hypothetical protein
VTALLEEEAQENCEPEPRRIVLTPENIAARGKWTHAIHAQQAIVEEPRRMRRAQEGGTAAQADTVGVRREAVRFAEDAMMDPSNCLMETLVLRENQEGIRIRRSPGDNTKHLPWVLERVILQTLCGPSNDEQGQCASSNVRGNGGRCVSGNAPGSRDQYVRGNARGDCSRCASSKVQGDGGRCVSSGVRQSSDPGGGPEPEADYEPAFGKLLGVPDEIQVLNRPMEVRMPEPAIMRAREVPGEQTAPVGERVQKTARLFNPHGSPPIMWEGGEDESALKDIRKQSAAQRVPAQLRSSFQPEPRREATCAERTKEPIPGKVSGQPTIKTQESIMLPDGELCGDREDAMRDSQRAAPPDEMAAGVRAMPPTNAVRGRRRTGQAAEVAEALMPSPAGEDPPTVRNGRPTTSGMSAGGTAATADKDGPVAPLLEEPALMKAGARVPHNRQICWRYRSRANGYLRRRQPHQGIKLKELQARWPSASYSPAGKKKAGMNHPSAAYGEAPMKRDNKGGTLDPVEPPHRHRNARRQARRILTSSNREQIRRLWQQCNVKRRPAERLV